MKIEKIEKMSKNIKEFLNNIDAIGIYYSCGKKHKPVEIQLGFEKFYKLFKNYLNNATIEFEEEEKYYSTKISKIKNYLGGFVLHFNRYNINGLTLSVKIDFILSYKIGNIKYFTFLKGCDEIKKINEAINV